MRALPLTRKALELRRKQLYEQRDMWKAVWEDLANYIMPDRGFFDGREPNRGERRDTYIIDSIPVRSAQTLAAGMQSGLTSPAQPWFRLSTHDPALAQRPVVRLWLDDVQRRMQAVFAQSNFYNSLYNVYEELGVFGTAPLLIMEDFDHVIRCRALTCGEYALGTNAKLQVDTLYRTCWMTALQMRQAFGEEHLSEAVKSALENKPDEWFEVYHALEPNDDRIPGLAGIRNAPYRSVYWQPTAEEGKFLLVSGFETNPLMAPRWNVVGSDVYGRGPGWVALPDSKMLQKMQEDKLVGIDKLVNPPIQAPAGARNEVFNALPGGLSFYPDGQPNAIGALYQVNPNLNELGAEIREVQQAIREAFFVDMFLMLAAQDRPQMTAREVAERHQEKLLMLGPVLVRLQAELLDPAIDRVFDIMNRAGLIPPPPEELQGEPLRVDYISVLAQAQKMVATTGIEQLVAFTGSLVAVKPDVADKVDFDEAVDQYADALGTPPAIVRPDEVVVQIRQARAKAEQDAAQAQLMLQAAQGAKVLSETDTGGNNALTALLGGPIGPTTGAR